MPQGLIHILSNLENNEEILDHVMLHINYDV